MLEHPELIDNEDVVELETLVRKYPYFTVGQVLLAVGMKRYGHERSTRQLAIAAAMTPDRNALRKLFTQLPDEYVAEPEIIPEKTLLIPEINLSGTTEDLNREVALLEEKKKTLDELMSIIENKISELEKEKKQTKKNCQKQKLSTNLSRKTRQFLVRNKNFSTRFRLRRSLLSTKKIS